MMRKEKYQTTFFVMAALAFSLGYIIILTNAYYHIEYSEFIESGRQDLIARLGFLTFATGVIYFPLVIIPVLFLTWLSKKKQKLQTKALWVASLLGIIIAGILFYMRLINPFIYLSNLNWIIGIILIALSILLFWNSTALNKMKDRS